MLEELSIVILFILKIIFKFFLYSIGFVVLRLITFFQYPTTFQDGLLFPHIILVDFIGTMILIISFYIVAQI